MCLHVIELGYLTLWSAHRLVLSAATASETTSTSPQNINKSGKYHIQTQSNSVQPKTKKQYKTSSVHQTCEGRGRPPSLRTKWYPAKRASNWHFLIKITSRRFIRLQIKTQINIQFVFHHKWEGSPSDFRNIQNTLDWALGDNNLKIYLGKDLSLLGEMFTGLSSTCYLWYACEKPRLMLVTPTDISNDLKWCKTIGGK